MALQLTYKSKRIEKACTDFQEAEKQYGTQIAEALHLRLEQISAADSVELLVRFAVGKCHPLTGDRKEQYAMFLTKNWRLIFEKVNGSIHVVKIMEIVDYH